MLACNCELSPSWCRKCNLLRKHNKKSSKPETNLLRVLNGKALPYKEAKPFFTGKDIEKMKMICLRED